jgi:glycyl-tRNA synthetase beta chain
LRRAAIGFLRTLLAKRWELSISEALELAYARYDATKLDLNARETCDKLAGFLRHRLRGVLGEPADVVDACIAASSDRPYDVALRVAALAAIDPEVRASAGEVFKRAANIAKDAPDGEPVMPKQVQKEVHPSEQRLFDEYERLKQRLAGSQKDRDYRAALSAISGFAPTLARFFVDVYVMVDDLPLRHNRLRLMREIHRTGSALANFNLLAKRTED